eukprot:CAMPEP_0196771230 /NCGR_PEP_ID=MMETSP1104-20130614/1569_1 /TAXON_ID=33652 /ORGANISM="Cafeteria sp., Strain Caron Lab Isolate" /LENGTH=60 /DNA_ID=CAMNT_0042141347 /DNA_START=80 /DNA_END=259 /DNA_ORIENTATION=-
MRRCSVSSSTFPFHLNTDRTPGRMLTQAARLASTSFRASDPAIASGAVIQATTTDAADDD